MKRIMVGYVAMLSAVLAYSQQAPGGRGGGGRGGGFRQPDPIDFEDHAGWTQMWDGSTFKGWDGDFNFWKIENGAIVVESTCEKPTGTIYLIWQGGEAADFEMKLEMKGEGAAVNSGVQYRGAITEPRPPGDNAGRGPGGGRGRGPQGPCPSGAARGTPPSRESQAKWDMLGAQFDFDGRNQYSGQFYEQATGRGIIAWRGQVVRTEEGKSPRLLATLGHPEELGGYVKIEGWNQLHIIARGNTMTHIINGHVMSVLVDDDATKFRKSGLIGVEIEGTGKISMRNLWLKRL
ncbi:MAG: hypothetical protein QOJ99_4957 [Bryobacterales bacterium]|nr:hypothetical protein [Bryobacterales bacterium]